VKAIIRCLGPLALCVAGCLPSSEVRKPDAVAKPPEVEFVEPPNPVKPEEVNEANTRDVVKRLDVELRYEEHPEAPKKDRE